MKRTIKIVGYAVMLFVLYIGSTAMLKSCKSANTGETIVEDDSGDEFSSDEEIYDEYFESDENEEDVSNEGTEEAKIVQEEVVEKYDEDFSFEADEEEKKKINEPTTSKPKPRVQSSTPSRSSASTASTGGNYLVVAGSYLIKDNAEKMITKLKNIGYSGAEIVNFDLSQYHSISAGRYATYDKAGEVVKVLKNKGIDCYVHTRK